VSPPPSWLGAVLVAVERLPGARAAIVGELVVGSEATAKAEALRWVAMLADPSPMVQRLTE
jgi:hypothetical protein